MAISDETPASNINSFDVVASWNKPPSDHYSDSIVKAVYGDCQCGMCKLGRGGHL